MRALFARVARPIATASTPGAWLAGRRLLAIDRTCLDVPDTADNEAFFGRPGVNKGEKSAFPQARLVAVAECGTHAIIDAEVGPCTTSEPALALALVGRLRPGSLLLADRGFTSYAMWTAAAATGADLLWRAKTNTRPQHVETLPDGSWLAEIRLSTDRDRPPVTVRVVDYTIDDGREHPGSYRLFTSILDPGEASAADLAAAYVQRWEIETAFDELKTHQRGPGTVLRSKSPDLVQQEIWGHLCCHYAIRTLMAHAAEHAGHDPDGLSFTAAVRITRQTIAHQGDFPPDQQQRLWAVFLRRLLNRLNPARRHRSAPRVIKRKMPKWHVKRSHHAHRPEPQRSPNYTVTAPI